MVAGFTSLQAQGEALTNYYCGPTWRARRDEANATMLDSDNALLPKPVALGPAYPALDAPRPSVLLDDGTPMAFVSAVRAEGDREVVAI